MEPRVNPDCLVRLLNRELVVGVKPEAQVPTGGSFYNPATLDFGIRQVLFVEPEFPNTKEGDPFVFWWFDGVGERDGVEFVSTAFESRGFGSFLETPLPSPVSLIKSSMYDMCRNTEFFTVPIEKALKPEWCMVNPTPSIILNLPDGPIVNPREIPEPLLQFFLLSPVEFQFELPDYHLGFPIAKTIESRTT